MNEIPQFSASDFKTTDKPYAFIVSNTSDDFSRQTLVNTLADMAKDVGARTEFIKLWRIYCKQTGVGNSPDTPVRTDIATDFPDQPIVLDAPQYICNTGGVFLDAGKVSPVVITHPLTITARLHNIESGDEKLEIAFYRGDRWRYVIADKETLFSANKIVALANRGIAVNSNNAKDVIQFLNHLESENWDIIPVKECIGRLGWIDHDYSRFAPYDDNVSYDGGATFQTLFDSVKPRGDKKLWLDTINRIRFGSVPARAAIAASFASALIKPLNLKPFILQLWGIRSSTGKTVALDVAASVWASPNDGEYVQSMNGTKVSFELTSGFLSNLPLILDEFQLVQNKETVENLIYMLSEGVGRSRGQKSGGVQQLSKWANTVIISGESPVTDYTKGEGAFYRVIEIECKNVLFDNPREVIKIVKNNYGFGGRDFIDCLSSPDAIRVANAIYDGYYKQLQEMGKSPKQVGAGALLLTADYLSGVWVFNDKEHTLTVEDIAPFLLAEKAQSTGERSYEVICDNISKYESKFNPQNPGDCYGRIDYTNNIAYVIKTVFDDWCKERGFSPRSVLGWMIENDAALSSGSGENYRPTVVKKFEDKTIRCVAIRLNLPKGCSLNVYNEIPD